MKNTFLFLFCLLSLHGMAVEKPQAVDSKIQRVTVFKSGAQVFRTASVNLIKGRQTLVFKNLSPFLDENSVEVSSQSMVQIVGVKTLSNQIDTSLVFDKSKEMDSKIDELKSKLELEMALSDVFQKEEEILLKNQVVGGNNGIKVEELKEAMAYFGSKLDELKRKRLQYLNSTNKLREEIDKLYKESSKLKADQQKLVSEIWVEIESKEALAASFTVAYKIRNASWQIAYDVRMSDVSSPLKITYNAKVSQTSGEDWNNVKLSLSTDNPNQPNQAPTLFSWVLGQNPPKANTAFVESNVRSIKGRVTDSKTGETLIGCNVLLMKNGVLLTGASTDINGNYSLNTNQNPTSIKFQNIGFKTLELPITGSVIMAQLQPELVELKSVVVADSRYSKPESYHNVNAIERTCSSVIIKDNENGYTPTITHTIPFTESDASSAIVYEIELPYTIKANGEETKVSYKESEVPCYFEYKAIPKLDLNVYLIAHLPGWEALELSNGEMNLYIQGSFKGKGNMVVEGITQDTFDISLGIDKSLSVTRKNLKKFKKNEFLSSDRIETREYEISVKNNKTLPIHLTVIDQVPISPYDGLKVEKILAEGAKQNAQSGELCWQLDLQPNDSKKLPFSYQLKVPKNFNLIE